MNKKQYISVPDSRPDHVQTTIPLVMDDRECRGPMPKALADCGAFALETRRLEIGDYLLDGAFLVERKTLPDFVASIKDGRIFSQALRLAEAEQRAVLLLEGTSRDLSACGMRWEAIQGALITVSLFVGLPVLRSRCPAETVRTMLYAARQHRAVTTGALPRHGQRPKGKKALQNHILQGLPGVGPQRAKRLLEHFGSVGAVVAAESAALQSVAGIGPRTASRMIWSVEEPPVSYCPAASDAIASDAAHIL
jgi:ERCC4-type nuclease